MFALSAVIPPPYFLGPLFSSVFCWTNREDNFCAFPLKTRAGTSPLVLCLLTILFGCVSSSFAQGPPVIDPTFRSGEPPPLEKKQPPKPTPPKEKLLPSPDLPSDLQGGKLPVIRMFVREIRVTGSTVFTPKELTTVVGGTVNPATGGLIVNRKMSTEDLEKVRRAVTLLYVNNGYINSGAVIPDQTVEEGVITIEIIEGELTDVEIEDEEKQSFLPFYLKDRIRLSAGKPLNIQQLRERLQLLLQDPRFKRLNAELKPGLTRGSSILRLRVEEASPYKAWVEFNNFQSPTVGAERGLATVSHQNVMGLGDIFTFTFGRSGGVDPLIQTNYTLPITARDTELSFGYNRSNFAVIEAPFDVLNVESETEIITIRVRHPVFRTPTEELTLTLTGEHLQNQSFLSGIPFSFTPGTTTNGFSIVSALRFAQEYLKRGPAQVLAFRSRFSVGLDILDATNNRIGPNDADGQFFVWLGQAQIARRFDPFGIQLISGIILQLANDSLFPLEQFAMGGRFSVRGYRENQLVRDNGFVFNLESRIPVLRNAWVLDSLYLAPFLDVGKSWNVHFPDPTTTTLASVGLGLRASLFQRAQFSLYWGVPLNHVPTTGGNIQDDGIHLQLVVNVWD